MQIFNSVLHIIKKNIQQVPVSIAQLMAWTFIVICRGRGSNPGDPTYSPSKFYHIDLLISMHWDLIVHIQARNLVVFMLIKKKKKLIICVFSIKPLFYFLKNINHYFNFLIIKMILCARGLWPTNLHYVFKKKKTNLHYFC